MQKVTAVDLNETIMVDDELEIKAYYAGHVIGAAMFYIRGILLIRQSGNGINRVYGRLQYNTCNSIL